MRILLVEDDVKVANGLCLVLRSHGANVDQAHTTDQALDLMGCCNYDISIIGVILPDIEGFDVIRRLRDGGYHLPVLIMSGLSTPAIRASGLSAGADDFITKPFDNDELLARLRAVLRRSSGASTQPMLRVGSVQLNPNTRDVTVGDQPVALTGKEYAVLELLFLRKGMALTKEAFLAHIYQGRDEPGTKIIDVFICKIRKKLAEAGAPIDLIRTVWGRGYTVLEPSNARGQIERTAVLDRAMAAS